MCAKNQFKCGRCDGELYLSEGYDSVNGLNFHMMECGDCGETNHEIEENME